MKDRLGRFIDSEKVVLQSMHDEYKIHLKKLQSSNAPNDMIAQRVYNLALVIHVMEASIKRAERFEK